MLKNKIQKIRAAVLAAVLCLGFAAIPLASAVYAAPVGEAQKGVNQVGGSGQNNLPDLIQNVINILLFVIGAVAVIMIIVGGIRYVVSNGDQASITGAKNTILYAVVGLVVAIMAYAIVNFILNSLK